MLIRGGSMKAKGRKKGKGDLGKKKFPSIRSLTHSSRSLFANCRKKYYWRYEERLTPIRISIPLTIGSVFHDEMDVFYQNLGHYGEEGIADAQIRIMHYFHELRRGNEGNYLMDWQFETLANMEAICCGMVAGYIRKYEDKDARRFKVIEPERAFSVPVAGTDWVSRGKIDLLVVAKEGEHAGSYGIVEHKTASQISVGFVSRIKLDRQTLRYAWAAQKIYSVPVKFVVYNVVKKPAIRQKKKQSREMFIRELEEVYEDEAKYFYRETIPLTQEHIQLVPDDDVEFVRHIEQAQDSNYFYMNTDHCNAYNTMCPYACLCLDGQTKDSMSGYRVRKHLHEELDGE